jgi:hypothetical protein
VNPAALAICGAAWLGGISVLTSTGRIRLGRGAVSLAMPVAAIGALAAIAAAPLLLLVPTALPPVAPDATVVGPTASVVPSATAGLLAALIGAYAIARRSAVVETGAIAFADDAPTLGPLTLILGSGAAGLAAAGVADPSRSVVLAAGVGLVAAAAPAMLLARAGRRLDAGAIGVVGAVLVAAASAAQPGADLPSEPETVALAGALVAALALTAGWALPRGSFGGLVPVVGSGSARWSDAAVVVTVVVPLGVAAASLDVLWSANDASGLGSTRSGALLAAVGSLGAALLAIADAGARTRRPFAVLPFTAAVPLAAFALALPDPRAGILVAAAAALVAAVPGRDGAHPFDHAVVAAAAALLAAAGLAIAEAADASAPVLGLGALLVAAAVAVRLGAIPFHRPAAALADDAPAAMLGVAFGWLPAVFAFVALGGISAVVAGGGRMSDATAMLVVVAIGVATLLLGAAASLVQERLAHALAYLVIAQVGWAVLAAIDPSAASSASAAWLPAFAAGSLSLGGVALLAEPQTGPSQVSDLARSPLRAAIAVLALVGAAIAFLGAPLDGALTSRAAIATGALGEGGLAGALVALATLLTIVAAGRLVLAALPALVRPTLRSRGGIGRHGIGRVGTIGAEAVVALVALLAVAIGLGLAR